MSYRAGTQRTRKSAPAGVGQESKGSKRVLVIDDYPDIREMFAIILSRAGYDVVNADSAAAALEAARSERFDLIISDIGMPGMNGYELAKELRSLPEYRTVPVIAVTSYAEFGDRNTAVWAGFDEHLHKPVESAKLLETVTRFIGAGIG
jgi:two-component system CheB/CheR fusion protein